MKKNIAVLAGDGVGPELVKQSIKILNAISKRFNHTFEYHYGVVGAKAIDETGYPLPKNTINICLKSDAILLGTIGDPKYDNNPIARPEQGLLMLRKKMGLYCNIRPIIYYQPLLDQSPIKNKHISETDLVIYRELIGGIYLGKKGLSSNTASDYCRYSSGDIERISLQAFKAALKRRKKLTLIDKANVLETSRLWRETVKKISLTLPEVMVNFLLVDNAAMQLIINPKQFDVILTDNMFGDILSDEASVINGSLGLLPSASIGKNTALFEPIHGSYPQATGKNIANPMGCILSVAMMLDYFELHKESTHLHRAIKHAIDKQICTADINNLTHMSTKDVGYFVYKYVLSN